MSERPNKSIEGNPSNSNVQAAEESPADIAADALEDIDNSAQYASELVSGIQSEDSPSTTAEQNNSTDAIFEEVKNLIGPLLGNLIEELEKLLISFKSNLGEIIPTTNFSEAGTRQVENSPEELIALLTDSLINENGALRIANSETLARFIHDGHNIRTDRGQNDLANGLSTLGIKNIILESNGDINSTERNGVRVHYLNTSRDSHTQELTSSSRVLDLVHIMYTNFGSSAAETFIGTNESLGKYLILLVNMARNPDENVEELIRRLGYSEFVTQNDNTFNIRTNLNLIKNNSNGIREIIENGRSD